MTMKNYTIRAGIPFFPPPPPVVGVVYKYPHRSSDYFSKRICCLIIYFVSRNFTGYAGFKLSIIFKNIINITFCFYIFKISLPFFSSLIISCLKFLSNSSFNEGFVSIRFFSEYLLINVAPTTVPLGSYDPLSDELLLQAENISATNTRIKNIPHLKVLFI